MIGDQLAKPPSLLDGPLLQIPPLLAYQELHQLLSDMSASQIDLSRFTAAVVSAPFSLGCCIGSNWRILAAHFWGAEIAGHGTTRHAPT